jgi:membrane fusion protein (multidrug efflux system)
MEAAVALAATGSRKPKLAPFSGLIGSALGISLGDYVKEGQDMVNLESIDPLKVDFGFRRCTSNRFRSGRSSK